MKQPQKSQSQIFTPKRRCTFRANRFSWCKTLKKICDAPSEYISCSNYQPKPVKTEQKLHQNEQRAQENNEVADSPHTLLIGVKTGQCDICKVPKKILLLRYGFSLCEDCLNVCATILEQLQLDETKPPKGAKNYCSSSKRQTNQKKKLKIRALLLLLKTLLSVRCGFFKKEYVPVLKYFFQRLSSAGFLFCVWRLIAVRAESD